MMVEASEAVRRFDADMKELGKVIERGKQANRLRVWLAAIGTLFWFVQFGMTTALFGRMMGWW